jgi:hypothetical protein
MSAISAATKARVDAVFALAKKQRLDEEAMSHWARYLCVLTSGYVEVSLRAILADYVAARAHPDILNYVESRLEGVTNLNEERVYQLLTAFRPEWGEIFRRLRSDEQKDALDSVVANRNQLAHGRSVGLTLARMTEYFQEIASALDLIEEKCVK